MSKLYLSQGENKMINKELLLNRITQLCQERNWSYNQLTTEADLSPGMIYQWYSKKRNRKPSFEALDKICGAFKISLSEFFSECKKDRLSCKENRLLGIIEKLDDKEVDLILNIAEKFLENKVKLENKD